MEQRTTVQLLTQVWRDITSEVFHLSGSSVRSSPIETMNHVKQLDFVTPIQGAALALYIDWFVFASCVLSLNLIYCHIIAFIFHLQGYSK
jgi:hypothetical protein